MTWTWTDPDIGADPLVEDHVRQILEGPYLEVGTSLAEEIAEARARERVPEVKGRPALQVSGLFSSNGRGPAP